MRDVISVVLCYRIDVAQGGCWMVYPGEGNMNVEQV